MPARSHMLQDFWLKKKKGGRKNDLWIGRKQQSWEAVCSSSHKGSAVWTLQHAGFDELTVKYHKPKNSEFWDFYPQGKENNNYFFFLLFVCKMPLKLYIYFILCMLIYLVFNNLTIIFQVPRLLLWQYPGPPLCSSTLWLSATLPRAL